MPPRLTNVQRTQIKDFLMEHSTNMILQSGKINEAAAKWNVTRRTISTIWSTLRKLRAAGLDLNVDSKMKGKKSRPCLQIDHNKILLIAQEDRNTIERFSISYGCSKSTIWRWIKKHLLRSHTNEVHPQLTSDHKLLRLKFTLSAVFVDRILQKVKFKSMFGVVHMDEKWFIIGDVTEKFILLPEEANPYRACQNKKYIQKIMFMCAVARPCFGDNGEVLFDGKIGIFPFTEQVPAVRSSRNRPAGTLVLKPMASVNKEKIKACLINQVLPAIKAKWPANASKHIYLQQDNATPHIMGNDPDFVRHATSDGFNIQLVRQPPKSPDFNINDLGFFYAIQSLKNKSRSRNFQQLIEAVDKAFTELAPSTLNKVFLSLQAVMIETMKRRGHNDYALPHLKKSTLQRRGELPIDLEVDEGLVRECIDYLQQLGQEVDNERLMQDLGYH